MTRKKTITLLGSTTVGLLTVLATAGFTGNTIQAGATPFSPEATPSSVVRRLEICLPTGQPP
jgi:hypothetical protein